MSGGATQINLLQFCIVYALLLVTVAVMKKCHVDRSKQLLVASLRMTVQLTIAGFILTFIFQNPHPAFTVAYIVCMTAFAIKRALKGHENMNPRFKLAVGCSIALSGCCIMVFLVRVVIGESLFNPQYVIPLSGMIMGNTMTGVSLGLRSFTESVNDQRIKIDALLNMGAHPKAILLPLVNRAIETALLPTMNSMVGMGIVSLPGMMTGQILSGTLPTTAILYQIAIMISICTVVCLAVFGSLYMGYQTLYNQRKQLML